MEPKGWTLCCDGVQSRADAALCPMSTCDLQAEGDYVEKGYVDKDGPGSQVPALPLLVAVTAALLGTAIYVAANAGNVQKNPELMSNANRVPTEQTQ